MEKLESVCVCVSLRSPVDADGSQPALRRSHFPATDTPPTAAHSPALPHTHFTEKNLIYFPWASGKIIIISIFLLRLSSVKLTARGVYLTVTRGGWRLEAGRTVGGGRTRRHGVAATADAQLKYNFCQIIPKMKYWKGVARHIHMVIN